MLMSDGCREAADAAGALFGLGRMQSLMRTAASAGEVANAAHHFGPDDDITIFALISAGALHG
jgi:hypothetical protein